MVIRNPKNNILVSFSGGESSGFMIDWLLRNKRSHNLIFIFANTGEENEETLEFVQNCSEYFRIKIIWLEYERLGFKLVDFNSAYRSHNPTEVKNKWKNHPFRKMIAHFGIPNINAPICTRELKEYPIRRYMTSIGMLPKLYDIAIGIRSDEIDRVKNHYYPLAIAGITKPMVNRFWNEMPFRLNLKGYQGNCKTCWKKSYRKLGTIALEARDKFGFFGQMEKEYGNFIPKGRSENKIKLPLRFFRKNLTVQEIFDLSNNVNFKPAKDDSIYYQYQMSLFDPSLDASNGCIESCEVF